MPVNNGNYLMPLTGCFVLLGLFVGSLYVWDLKYDRNHPRSVKQRFCSVFIVALISPVILKIFITSEEFTKFTIFELIGFRTPGFFNAALIPLFLTVVLYLGPLCMQDPIELCHTFWIESKTNLLWIRNVLVSPFTEELTFRACMMPLLLQCYKPTLAVFICSLFFGIAHFHHVIESYKFGEPLHELISKSLVQFSYTTLFGAYSAYFFVQTGHFIAPFLVHSFCNAMGFPDFEEIFTCENPKRRVLIVLLIVGVVFWSILFKPLTNYELYENSIFFKNETIL